MKSLLEADYNGKKREVRNYNEVETESGVIIRNKISAVFWCWGINSLGDCVREAEGSRSFFLLDNKRRITKCFSGYSNSLSVIDRWVKMNVVGKVGSLISQGVYSVATPFHPFGGAVDVIIVEQQDGTYRSTPWYVRFGKFQGVLKGAEKVVRISVNGVDAGFHMYLDNSGEAYFVREVVSSKDTESDQHLKNSDISESTQDDNGSNLQSENGVSNAGDIEFSNTCVENGEIENEEELLEFRKEQASQASPVGSLGYGAYHYGSLDQVEDLVKSQGSESEVVLVSVDGHVLTAPISSSEENTDNVQLSTPQFHLGPAEGTEVTIEQLQDSAEFSGNNGDLRTSEDAWVAGLFGDLDESKPNGVFEGIPPVSDGADTFDYSSDGCKAARKLSYQTQEAPNMENVGDNLGMHSSSEDIDASMSRNEIFRSCMELSELTLSIDDENSQGTGFPLMGLAVNSGTYDSQENSPSTLPSKEETQAGDHQKLENRATVPFPISNPLCNDESPTVPIQIEASENNAVVNENTDDVVSVPTITNVSRKYEQLGAAPEPQNSESERMIVPEEECTKLKTGESLSAISGGGKKSDAGLGFEISLCRNLLHAGIGLGSAEEAFNAHQISAEEFKVSGGSIIKNENLIVRFKGQYLTWDKAAPIILGMAAFGLDFPAELKEAIPVEQVEMPKSRENSPVLSSAPSGRSWRLWPIPFRRVKTLQHSNSTSSSDEIFVDSVPYLSPLAEPTQTHNSDSQTSHKQFVRTNIPTSEQIASLNLKDGQNMVAFSFSTRVLGNQQVDAHIYLWKWNTRIVISDVDGTITRSDVLGQFMPLVGKDWTQSGVAGLFSAIKENGYQLLFLSARAIVQAYLTRSFLLNLKQDGKALPSGPVVISPDGLFPSLYREVIRRAPHEFKIACLQDIRALFPSDYNPFYAGFGNRDTDELSYRKMGIPKGKIFIINPKGEVAVNHHCIDVKSYTSLHTLVHDMFPPTSLAEQEDFNSWNYWKMPIPDIDC